MLTILQLIIVFFSGIAFTILMLCYLIVSSADEGFTLFSRLFRYASKFAMFGKGINGGAGDDNIFYINTDKGKK